MKMPALFSAAPPADAVYTKPETQYIDQERKNMLLMTESLTPFETIRYAAKRKLQH